MKETSKERADRIVRNAQAELKAIIEDRNLEVEETELIAKPAEVKTKVKADNANVKTKADNAQVKVKADKAEAKVDEAEAKAKADETEAKVDEAEAMSAGGTI
jgi:hypothetical protein